MSTKKRKTTSTKKNMARGLAVALVFLTLISTVSAAGVIENVHFHHNHGRIPPSSTGVGGMQ